MKISETAVMFTIYIGESDHINGEPLYQAIVKKARELNLAGATAFRGIMGFGANSRLHTFKVLRLSEDMPIIIQIIDTEENLEKIMPFLDENVKEGLITKEKMTILKYRTSN